MNGGVERRPIGGYIRCRLRELSGRLPPRSLPPPSVPGVRRTLARRPVLASRAEWPLMIRQKTWPGRGANGQEAPKIDARQLDVHRRAGLITALTSPTGSSAPMAAFTGGFAAPASRRHQQIERARVRCLAGHTRPRPERAAEAPLLCREQGAVVRDYRHSSLISGATRLLLKNRSRWGVPTLISASTGYSVLRRISA